MRRYLAVAAIVALLVAPLPVTGLLDGGDTPDALPKTVTVVRDEFGVPHIYADSERGLWYANGYVQAQDRLWAMDLLRHLGYGEGASVVGPGGGILEMDLNTRRNLYNETQLRAQMEQAQAESPAFVAAVEAFTEGVNRAAAEMHANGELPAEFPALQHSWHEWKPIDTVAVATFLLAEFGNGGGGEISNAKVLGQLEAELGSIESGETAETAFTDLLWGSTGDTYDTIQDKTMAELGIEAPQSGPKDLDAIPAAQLEATRQAQAAGTFGLSAEEASVVDAVSDTGFYAGEDIEFTWGSNALIVSAELAEGGQALVGGGPQMGYFNPQIPYEVGLHAPGIEAEGMGVTGAPGVIIGRMANFALTVTSGISDQTDIVGLPAAEDAGDRAYTWDGEVQQLDCRNETHRLFTPPALYDPASGQAPVRFVEQEVCFSQAGPIVAVSPSAEDPEMFFAKKTSSRMQEVSSAVSWLSVSQRDNLEDFRGVFDDFAFTFNFHYVGENAAGEEVACYHHVGLQPIRHNDLDPRLPTPAGSDWAWQGNLTGDEMPWYCDQSQGYFAQWNNRPIQGWSSGDSRELWGSMHRVERLDRAVQQELATDANGKLTLDQVKSILKEAATHDSLAHEIVGELLSEGHLSDAPAAEQALAEWQAEDFPWDATVTNETGAVLYEHRGHTVYDKLLPALLEEIYGDELGDHVRSVNLDPRDSSDPHAGDHGQHNNPFSVVYNALRGETTYDWCDGSCADEVDAALASTGLAAATNAEDIERTEEHRSPFTSLGLGPAYTMPMTNRATFYHFHVGSDTSESYATLPPGADGSFNVAEAALIVAAGQPPEHNHDQLELYKAFEFKHVPWTLENAQEDADSTEILVVPPSTS